MPQKHFSLLAADRFLLGKMLEEAISESVPTDLTKEVKGRDRITMVKKQVMRAVYKKGQDDDTVHRKFIEEYPQHKDMPVNVVANMRRSIYGEYRSPIRKETRRKFFDDYKAAMKELADAELAGVAVEPEPPSRLLEGRRSIEELLGQVNSLKELLTEYEKRVNDLIASFIDG